MLHFSDKRTVTYSPSYMGALHLLFCGRQHLPADNPTVVRTPEFFLLHYIESGSGEFSSDETEPVVLHAGDWFFCYPGQTIRYRQNPQDPWTYRWVCFAGHQAAELLAQMGITAQTGHLSAKPSVQTIRCLGAILTQLEQQNPRSTLCATQRLLDLLIMLCDQAARQGLSPESRLHEDIGLYIENACQFMLLHFSEGIGANDVCRFIGFERTYFSKCFSRETGHTLQEHLARLRLSRAEELLAQNNLTVEEIALATGYRQAKVFARFFKQQTGVSPGQWRNRHPTPRPSNR